MVHELSERLLFLFAPVHTARDIFSVPVALPGSSESGSCLHTPVHVCVCVCVYACVCVYVHECECARREGEERGNGRLIITFKQWYVSSSFQLSAFPRINTHRPLFHWHRINTHRPLFHWHRINTHRPLFHWHRI